MASGGAVAREVRDQPHGGGQPTKIFQLHHASAVAGATAPRRCRHRPAAAGPAVSASGTRARRRQKDADAPQGRHGAPGRRPPPPTPTLPPSGRGRNVVANLVTPARASAPAFRTLAPIRWKARRRRRYRSALNPDSRNRYQRHAAPSPSQDDGGRFGQGDPRRQGCGAVQRGAVQRGGAVPLGGSRTRSGTSARAPRARPACARCLLARGRAAQVRGGAVASAAVRVARNADARHQAEASCGSPSRLADRGPLKCPRRTAGRRRRGARTRALQGDDRGPPSVLPGMHR
jgi:hypothetical protein